MAEDKKVDKKDKIYKIVLNGGFDPAGDPLIASILALGGPFAIAQISKSGEGWVSSITVYHTMTAEQLALLNKATNDFLKDKKINDSKTIDEVMDLQLAGAKFLVDQGRQVAKDKKDKKEK